jgi:uncharacterized protein (DUF111 family)
VVSVHLRAGAIEPSSRSLGGDGLQLLGVDHVVCGLVNPTGFANMAQALTVPAPATAEAAQRHPHRVESFSETRKELVTPTGALIQQHLVE